MNVVATRTAQKFLALARHFPQETAELWMQETLTHTQPHGYGKNPDKKGIYTEMTFSMTK